VHRLLSKLQEQQESETSQPGEALLFVVDEAKRIHSKPSVGVNECYHDVAPASSFLDVRHCHCSIFVPNPAYK
jgi:hypothetical protein